jgi:hypothetical protein
MPNYDEKSDDPAEKPKGFDTNHSTTVKEYPPTPGGGVAQANQKLQEVPEV